ncbi:hypothetical protein SLEP1_g11204 [Rubroshorea leprosula]|uniref:Glycosyltransferase n=1 Tax=Rubroshorea leprosula TaxID=152421 RepID=A0AAV5ILD2_9ROSI|nr:hypothetical protein SLEP1_g11204 [Rubroshorea leprosula]
MYQSAMETQEAPLHVAMVAAPGIGHVIPLTELAKRLVHHNFAVTFFVPNDGTPMKLQKQLLQSLPKSISSVFLPPLKFDEDVPAEVRITLSLTLSIPALRDSFKASTKSTQVVAMVVDSFGMDAFDVAREFGVEPYVLFTTNAMALSFVFHLPKLDQMFSDPASNLPPVYPVGPMVQTASAHLVDWSNNCLKWLNEQPSGSVLYVCFGSGGILSQEQLNELAMGLERSGQRFLWVVKSPDDKATNATYFSLESIKDPFDFLPTGFLERTKGTGLVVPSWAPQVQVLSHGSTGGFVTHCGWNSTLEGIVHGVPLIAWPLYAEQRMNAVLLADDLKVALRVKVNEHGVVGREDISKYAKALIEGEEGTLLRNRMRKLKDAAKMVLSPDGSSAKSLANVVEIWKNQ